MRLFNKIIFMFFCVFLAVEGFARTKGLVSVSIYDQQQPLKSYPVYLDAVSLHTDRDGTIVHEISDEEVRLRFYHPHTGKVVEKRLKVVDQLNTFVIIHISAERTDFEIVEPKVYSQEMKKEDLMLFKGQILSLGKVEAVSGVRVYAKGIKNSVMSNHRGEFEIYLPKDQTQISLSHKNFNSLTQTINANESKEKVVQFSLSPKGLELEDFVVLAPRKSGSVEALIQLRQNSTEVADVMSSEQMSKSGDSDAAASLKRVTGLSLVDDKFVYVRGLGERYSNTLLNDVAIPSPDPSRRVVPLDLFPVGVLESLVIQKSYSADRTGEFGGGSILLQLKSFPEKSFFKASVGLNVINDSGRPFMTYEGGDLDWLGIDDGTRRLPRGLAGGNIVSGRALQSFNNINDTHQGDSQALPDLSLVYGNSYKVNKWRFSHLSSLL
ncbi:MAG: carboxypeptidase-like regulatory domain-containing protein, partial [Bdellovibrionales bacterium]|nr:carboxypeptidase-like regulatory domain-containing protein [Bdellovibrionales bacterium]